jgi:TPR repeat protein
MRDRLRLLRAAHRRGQPAGGERLKRDGLAAHAEFRMGNLSRRNQMKADGNSFPEFIFLGQCYAEGIGVAKNQLEAVKWFRKAAEQGNADAQYNLGCCYYDGKGVEKDSAEAVKWTRKAAEQNDADAQFSLGDSYGSGKGVEKDDIEAAKWYRKAAEQGHTDAQNNLGVSYAFGTGVVKDYVESYKWLDLAAAKGSDNAKKLMTVLEIKMTPEQIAEGQKLAREFKPNKPSKSEGAN